MRLDIFRTLLVTGKSMETVLITISAQAPWKPMLKIVGRDVRWNQPVWLLHLKTKKLSICLVDLGQKQTAT